MDADLANPTATEPSGTSLSASNAESGKIYRAVLPFTVERSGLDAEGQFRVTGIMNTFTVTRSRRILHPRGFLNWRKANPTETLPILANHGFVPTWGTIGEWDQFDFVEGRGMRWSGRVGKGTDLMDDTRTLLDQKLLKRLSLGWLSARQQVVRINDSDLDPHFKQAMEEAGIDQALAFIEWEPVEGSIVDVADDSGARLAAGRSAIEAAVAPLKAEVEELRARVERMTGGRESPELAGTAEVIGESFSEFLERWKDAALELLQSDALIGDAAEEFRELHNDLHDEGNDDEPARSNVEPSGDAGLDELLQRVARGPGR